MGEKNTIRDIIQLIADEKHDDLTRNDIEQLIASARIVRCERIEAISEKYQLWKVNDLYLAVNNPYGRIGVTPYFEAERKQSTFDISHRTFSKRDSKAIYKLLKKKILDI